MLFSCEAIWREKADRMYKVKVSTNIIHVRVPLGNPTKLNPMQTSGYSAIAYRMTFTVLYCTCTMKYVLQKVSGVIFVAQLRYCNILWESKENSSGNQEEADG